MQVKLYKGTPGFTLASFKDRLAEETEEVFYELVDINCRDYPTDTSYDFLLGEVFDVMQVCYSFLRSNFTVGEIEDANVEHLNKMRSRYGKD